MITRRTGPGAFALIALPIHIIALVKGYIALPEARPVKSLQKVAYAPNALFTVITGFGLSISAIKCLLEMRGYR